MGIFDAIWGRAKAKDAPAAIAEQGPSPLPPTQSLPRRTSHDRIEGIALRSVDSLGGVLCDPDRVRWVLLQPEVDGTARRFAALAGLGETRAAEAREAREALGSMLVADLPNERPDHIEQLLNAIQRQAREQMRLHVGGVAQAAHVVPAATRPAVVPARVEPPAPAAAAPAGSASATGRVDASRNDLVDELLGESSAEPSAYRIAPAPAVAAENPELPPEYELRVVSGSSASDLDLGLVRQYVQASSGRRPNSPLTDMREMEVLRALKAVEGTMGRERVTVIGGLFFATHPDQMVVQSKVRFVEFPGTEVANSGQKAAYRYTEEITGTIPELIARMERLHRERLAPGVLADGFRVEETPSVPLFALREAMVNAVCHRDYSLVGANIQVRLFEDRLEVQSPGGLPGPVTVDNIVNESYARNPRVADMLRDLGYVERHGLGIDNMLASMREAHLPEPEFANTDTSFTVTLRFRAADEVAPESWLAELGASSLPAEQQRALLYARRMGHVTVEDYLSFGALDESEAADHLRTLVRAGWLAMSGTGAGATYALGSRAGAKAVEHDVDASVPQAVIDALPSAQRRILEIVIRQGRVRAAEVLEISGLKDRRTIQRTLGALTERGLLVRHASSKTDPNATYMVNRDYEASVTD